MHDIWEPELRVRINQFITRKAKQYPELRLTNQPTITQQPDQRTHRTHTPSTPRLTPDSSTLFQTNLTYLLS